MIWVYVFGGIAVAGLIMVVAYAIWLAHKAADVFAELRVLGRRTGQLADLAAQIQLPDPSVSQEQSRDPDKNAIPTDRGNEYHGVGLPGLQSAQDASARRSRPTVK